MAQLLRLAGLPESATSPEPDRLLASPTRDQQLPFFRDVMARPLEAPSGAARLGRSYADASASPYELMCLTGALAGFPGKVTASPGMVPIETGTQGSSDPLASSVAAITRLAGGSGRPPPAVPDLNQLPDPFRSELALVLAAVSRSHQFLQRAFGKLPRTVWPGLLRRQALGGEFRSPEEPDYRKLLGLVEGEALVVGMLDLVAAVERLERFVTTTPALPSVALTLDTPMGAIHVDTTGQDNHYRLKDALLVLDVGGDDRYEFEARSEGLPVSILLDHGGNDHFEAGAPGSDPSSPTLGYGILWDTEGNDTYLGTQQAQASALFGAALLVDGGGVNRFVATSHSQAHAIGGVALLLSGTGDDRFTAQTHAQGSAGPQAVAVLMDPAGDDRYALNDTPLLRPSPQLPGHNTSMGQGAGRGIRGGNADGGSLAGGIGLLLDWQGNDRYEAQVFAQGAGYYQGLGLLVDGGGSDRFDAAWYAMGAAAHQGAGILLKRGAGADTYRSSHSMSLGAAHDFSVGIFLDEGGQDRYEAGDLSLGAAHDNSTALFVDAAGRDRYQVSGKDCRALGTARISEPGTVRDELLNLGLFMDLRGADSYPAHCAFAGDDASWTSRRSGQGVDRRGEAGAGLDGEWPLPFDLGPVTKAGAGSRP